MSTFRYELPKASIGPTLEGLSDEAKAALAPITAAPSPANELLAEVPKTFNELEPEFKEAAVNAYLTAKTMFGLINEAPAQPDAAELAEQLTRLEPYFQIFKKLDLKPAMVLTARFVPVKWWQQLASSLADSPFNSVPQMTSGAKEMVIKQPALLFNKEVIDHWDKSTNPDNESSTWSFEIISDVDEAAITGLTRYGYADDRNTIPGEEFNILLTLLGQPEIEPNARPKWREKQTMRLPGIYPTPEAYLALQFGRFIQHRLPMDTKNWSWLNGVLENGDVLGGCWHRNSNFALSWDTNPGFRAEPNFGLRPSVRTI